MSKAMSTEPISPGCSSRRELDESLSKRFIALDPCGYFLIRIDSQQQELVAEHYGNTIDDQGLARDPESGEVIRCQGAGPRTPTAIYRGRTAKELGMLLTEGEEVLLSRLDHALYLGRELEKAQRCLDSGDLYIQD